MLLAACGGLALLLAACGGLALSLAACGGSAEKKEPPRSPGYPQPFHLIPLLGVSNPMLRQTAALLRRTGNEREIRAGSVPLIQRANRVGSDAWREEQRPLVRYMSERKMITRGDVSHGLDLWQRRHLVQLYDAMEALGGKLIKEHCRAVVADDGRQPIERQLAQSVLGALARGHGDDSQPWATPGSKPSQTPPQSTAAPISPGLWGP